MEHGLVTLFSFRFGSLHHDCVFVFYASFGEGNLESLF